MAETPPVYYAVHLVEHSNGTLHVLVEGADDERSRLATAAALRRAADSLSEPRD